MASQHTENLFRRFRGELVTVKTVSGGIYHGRVLEITNDYVCLSETTDNEPSQVFLFFKAVESMMPVENPAT